MVLNGEGEIVELRVVESSGHDELDEAALAYVGELDNLPVRPDELGWQSQSFEIPLEFRL